MSEPIDERAADVQVDRQRRVIAERFQQRQIAISVNAVVNGIEIANRLVLVQHQDETQAMVHV